MRKVFPWLLPLVAFFFYPPASLPLSAGKWVALYGAAIFSAVYLLRGPLRLPRFSWLTGLSLGLVAVASLLHLFYFRPAGFVFVLADRLSFLFLSLGFAKSFLEGSTLKDYWLPATLGAFFAAVFALIGLGDPAGGLLGSSRAATDAIALLLLVAWAAPAPERAKPFVVQAFFAIASGLGIFVVVSRGENAALLGWGLAFVVLSALRDRERPVFRRAGRLGLGAGLVLSLLWVAPSFNAPLAGLERAAVWRATGQMIRTLPLGTGAGRFEFAALPFLREAGLAREEVLVASPQNEALRYLAEEGVLLSLAYLALWLVLLARWFRFGAPERAFVAAAFVFFVSSAIVSSPFLHASGALVLALVAGVLTNAARRGGEPLRPRITRGLLALGLLLIVGFGGAATLSRTFEDSAARAHLACALTPENWRACLTAARSLQDKGDWQGARHRVERVLAGEPTNFTAVRQLVFIAGNQKRNLEACFLLWRFDDFYRGLSSQHETLEKNCAPKWLEYFNRRRPTRIYERQGKTPTGFDQAPPTR